MDISADMMEMLMGQSMIFSMVMNLLSILTTVSGILFMHFSAKHRNYKLSTVWYVCGAIFGLWTVLVFLIKRKDFPGDKVKVCPQCQTAFYSNFVMCPNCLIDLPEYNSEIKQKEKKLSRLFGIAIIVLLMVTVVASLIWGVSMAQDIINNEDIFDSEEYSYRIPVDGVFYDKMGNSYTNEYDVLLYGEDGTVYRYVEENYAIDGNSYLSGFYKTEDGKKYYEYDCYVTSDGWFYCDKGGLLDYYSPDTGSMTEEELDEYYNNQMDSLYKDYRYYDEPFVDSDGNFYYYALEASWNEKGELITAENDVSIIK